MDLTLQIPQTIGTNFGTNNDGVIIGQVAHLDPTGSAYSTYAHSITYGVKANNNAPITPDVTWTQLQDSFNNNTPVSMFLPANVANAFPEMYFAVRDGVTGFAFNITTAAVGSFFVDAYYSTSSGSGYSPLTSTIFSSNFLGHTGLSTLTFTPPSDWAAENIGADVPRERWLLLKIRSGGTITTQPVTTGAWETTAVTVTSAGGTSNPPFYNPYNNLLPITGDALFLSSTYIPYGLVFTYTNPLTSASVSYRYSKADGSFGVLTPLSDTSSGFTAANSQTYLEYTLTSTGTNAFAASTTASQANCMVYGKVAALPTSSTNRFSIGMNTVNTAGTPAFALAVSYASGAPVYEKVIAGTPTIIAGTVPAINDVVEILRYNGKIYFFVNGVNIDPLSTPPTSTGLVYATFAAVDTAVSIPGIIFVDWSMRMAKPMTITFTAVTNFTSGSSSATRNFRGNFYVQFLPPSDFAPLTLAESNTGVAGYEIAVVTTVVGTAVVPSMKLQVTKFLTGNAPTNVTFPNGSQTILQLMNLDFADPTNYTTPSTFLLVMNNSAGVSTRAVTFPVPTTGNILSQAIPQIGMKSVMIVQVSGADVLSVGAPSFIYLGT